MRLDELDKKITQSDLDALEVFADRIFGKVGIDVEFTRHFLDRVNDDRNGEQITGSELTRLFKQEYKRWGKPIAQMGPDAEAVMKDLQTDINMPFALRWDRDNNELDLIVKTVMRKKDFKTSNKEFPVESVNEEEDCPACDGLGWDQSVTADEDDRGCDECGGTGKVNNETVNEESGIYKWNKEDPNNPEVLIQGYGRLMLNQIEDSIVGKLKELTKMAERGDFEQIQKLLDRDVMQSMMKAVVDTKAELQATRKRGGPKSRGINRESILDVVGKSETEEFELKEFTLTDIKDMVKKGWMARPSEKQWKELIKTYNKYKGNVTRKDLLDVGIAMLGRKESVKEAGGVGKVVPGINTTVDVGPDEIKKQAAKFGNDVDKDGVPKKNLR